MNMKKIALLAFITAFSSLNFSNPLPEKFSWRVNFTTPVKNQESCPSCEAHLFFCSDRTCSWENRGWVNNDMESIKRNLIQHDPLVGYDDIERYWLCKNSWGVYGNFMSDVETNVINAEKVEFYVDGNLKETVYKASYDRGICNIKVFL